jgi:hypothetical protein
VRPICTGRGEMCVRFVRGGERCASELYGAGGGGLRHADARQRRRQDPRVQQRTHGLHARRTCGPGPAVVIARSGGARRACSRAWQGLASVPWSRVPSMRLPFSSPATNIHKSETPATVAACTAVIGIACSGSLCISFDVAQYPKPNLHVQR